MSFYISMNLDKYYILIINIRYHKLDIVFYYLM